MSTHTAPETGTRPPALGRGERSPRELWQVPTFCTGLLVLLVLAASGSLSRAPADQLARDLADLRAALKDPASQPEALVPRAEGILERVGARAQHRAEAHFLAGLVYARLADHSPPERARDERNKAYLRLELAESLGLPPADQPRLHYYLGKLLFLSGGDHKRALDYLTRAAGGADDPTEGYGLLAQAYLRADDVDAALRANEKQIETTESEAAAAPAWLLRAQLLLRKGQRADALKVLRHIGSGAAREVRLEARYLQARAAQEERLFAQAIPLWNELLADPAKVPGGKGFVLYALGLCHAALEPREDAAAESKWREAVQLGGPQGQAASLRLAELRLYSKQRASALEWFARALEKVRTAKDYQNPILPLDQARELFEAGCHAYREGQEHEQAEKLAELYRRIALPGVAEERLAQAAEAHALALAARARQGVGPEASTVAEQAQALYRKAGENYKQSAAGRTPAERAARLRRGAECLLQARDHAESILLLKEYVDLEPAPERKVEGWFMLAGAYRAQKQGEPARAAYEQCIQHPRSPLAARARLGLADLAVEHGDLKQAEEVLVHALSLAGSTSDREAEEQVLYRLAGLLYQQGQRRFDDAAIRLEQALGKYPDNPGAPLAQDRLGECYRQKAEAARQESMQENLSGQKRALYRSTWQENLDKARKVYQKLGDDLEQRGLSRALAPAEGALLRKALLATADCIGESGSEMAEALRRYKDLAQRCRWHVEGLRACQGLFNCFAQAQSLVEPSGNTALVRQTQEATLAAVKVALEDVRDPRRIPDEVFRSPGNVWDRARWEQQLMQIANVVAGYPAAPAPGQGMR
ncbi:MAG: tetratricopeptide repeat protein [Gemmataceae bacterium]|nr:tetratricopeptide repeat protein [Gemmataceae bacterium]